MTEAKDSPVGLKRAVTRWELVGIAVNDVIGSGVYLLPAAAAALLGAASLWAVLLAGFAVLLLVLCFAEVGSYFDQPGSGYVYAREAFGDLVGFEVGWMTWLARVASVASLSNGFAQALTFMWPCAAAGWQRTMVIIVPLAAITWINIAGVKHGARLAVFLTVGKLVPLIVLIAVGVFSLNWRLLSVHSSPPPGNYGEAALLLLFAYAGFENTAAAAGEYRNPRRDVPFALVAMIVVVTLVYTLIQLVALGTLPDLAAKVDGAPLADALAGLLGSGAGLLMTLGAAISISGNIGSTMLAGPRYLFALSRDGYGPRLLGTVHRRYHTPAAAITVQALVSLFLALSGSFVQLAMLSIIARLSTYIGTAAAVPFLRRKYPRTEITFSLPGGPAIPAAAVILSIGMLLSTTRWNLLAGAAALAVGALLYATRRTRAAN